MGQPLGKARRAAVGVDSDALLLKRQQLVNRAICKLEVELESLEALDRDWCEKFRVMNTCAGVLFGDRKQRGDDESAPKSSAWRFEKYRLVS